MCARAVSSILQGVVSFMLDSAPAIGTVTTSDATKRQLARRVCVWLCVRACVRARVSWRQRVR